MIEFPCIHYETPEISEYIPPMFLLYKLYKPLDITFT